jgi:fructose-1,6-bisphosphatase I
MSLSKAALKISDSIKSIQIKDNTFNDVKKVNIDGDIQKPLDILSDEILIDFLKTSPVSGYASEEQDGFVDFKNDENFIVFADPLDGSSNIDVNVSIGTIFSIMSKNNLTLEKAFFQKGIFQKASGFFVYGPQTTLFLTVGYGTALFALDEINHKFVLIKDKIIIPESTSEFAINASYKRFWNATTTKYIKNCQKGTEGPRKKDFGMRWVGSLVADSSRILIRGGIFLYPSDSRKKYKDGRLRLTYEANPIAFLIEQANGEATNGNVRILNLDIKDIHQRTALIFGSSEEVFEYKNSC